MSPDPSGPHRRATTGAWLLVVAATVVAAGLAVGMILAAGRPRAVDPERAGEPRPAALQATREAPVPLAFRYRGVLCGPRGCLATTILRLCRSDQVARLHVRIEPLPGTSDALATLVAVPAGRAWDRRLLTRLASDPFQPERTWPWRQRPPPWSDWCQQVEP